MLVGRVVQGILTGIGFLGAGAIIHSEGTVSGITTAATIFVVASIGMAVGGGEYLSAVFATMVILVAIVIFWPGSVTYWIEKSSDVDPTKLRIELPMPEVPPPLDLSDPVKRQ